MTEYATVQAPDGTAIELCAADSKYSHAVIAQRPRTGEWFVVSRHRSEREALKRAVRVSPWRAMNGIAPDSDIEVAGRMPSASNGRS